MKGPYPSQGNKTAKSGEGEARKKMWTLGTLKKLWRMQMKKRGEERTLGKRVGNFQLERGTWRLIGWEGGKKK